MLKQIVAATYRPLLKRYLRKPRRYSYNGISIIVEAGVFHPAFFFSTKLLLKHIEKMNLKDKTLLELGAGNGLIAVYAATRGAIVTASDVSRTAVRTIEQNALFNRVNVTVLCSDMFDNIPLQCFDVIALNPPYYKKIPLLESDYAWYCGEQGEFFQRFFSGLGKYIGMNSTILMVLSDECDIGMVEAYAIGNGFAMKVVAEKKKYWETNYIFEIHKNMDGPDCSSQSNLRLIRKSITKFFYF
jgi:release factor glutamine methyltransferase